MPDNENPIIRTNAAPDASQPHTRRRKLTEAELDYPKGLGPFDADHLHQSLVAGEEDEEERIDSQEIFDLIRSITDPEHPLTLEDLSVVSSDQIAVTYPTDPDDCPHVMLRFTPTIPHCSMATLIGLTLRVRLLRSLPDRFKVDIKIKEGTHQSENSVNKQLNDKERVAAALENTHLLNVVQQCLSTAHLRGRKPTSDD